MYGYVSLIKNWMVGDLLSSSHIFWLTHKAIIYDLSLTSACNFIIFVIVKNLLMENIWLFIYKVEFSIHFTKTLGEMRKQQ